jgi:hypothetical protein
MDEDSGSAVSADLSRNLIELRWRGRVFAAQAKLIAEKVMILLPQVRRGFTLVADHSNLESMDLDSVPHITKIMDACNAAGIGTVVRIVPDPRKDIGFNILAITHYGRGVHVLTFQSAEEAGKAI